MGLHRVMRSTWVDPSTFVTAISVPTSPARRARKRADAMPGSGPHPVNSGQRDRSRISASSASGVAAIVAVHAKETGRGVDTARKVA